LNRIADAETRLSPSRGGALDRGAGAFAQQVLAEQETAEQRIDRMDQALIAYDQGHRDLATRHWRQGRRMIRSLPPELQQSLIDEWNQSSVPPDAAYFADFVRTRLRRLCMETEAPSR
jgi:hypothetical protein